MYMQDVCTLLHFLSWFRAGSRTMGGQIRDFLQELWHNCKQKARRSGRALRYAAGLTIMQSSNVES